MGAYTVTGQRARQMRVVPAEVLRRLSVRSDSHGLIQTAVHLSLLVAGGSLVLAALGTWWTVPALLLQGVLINALFGALHESVHYSSFKTRWMADLLAFFSGAAILNNAAFYRYFHYAHHRYTQDPERDPELLAAPAPGGGGQYLLRVSAIPFVMARLRDILFLPFGWRGEAHYIEDSAWPEIERWGRWLLVLYGALIAGSLALGSDIVLWVWLVPLLVGLPFLRLYLLCEHTLCPHSDDGFANTRTTRSNPVVRFLMWNLPYHAEHHLFPGIPFHHLPEAHRRLRPHLKYVAKGYIQVHREIIRSLSQSSS